MALSVIAQPFEREAPDVRPAQGGNLHRQREDEVLWCDSTQADAKLFFRVMVELDRLVACSPVLPRTPISDSARAKRAHPAADLALLGYPHAGDVERRAGQGVGPGDARREAIVFPQVILQFQKQ